MPKSTLFTLVSTNDKNDPETLEFGSKDAFAGHVEAHNITPDDKRYILLVNGVRTDWRVRTVTTVEIGDAPTPRAKRRSSAEVAAEKAAKAEAKRAKGNGSAAVTA